MDSQHSAFLASSGIVTRATVRSWKCSCGQSHNLVRVSPNCHPRSPMVARWNDAHGTVELSCSDQSCGDDVLSVAITADACEFVGSQVQQVQPACCLACTKLPKIGGCTACPDSRGWHVSFRRPGALHLACESCGVPVWGMRIASQSEWDQRQLQIAGRNGG